MAFTYDLTTDIGKIRLLIGDTDENEVLLQDEEIDFYIQTSGKLQIAASNAAKAIAAKFSREADKQIGSLKINLGSRSDNYMKLAKELKTGASSIITAHAGGISSPSTADRVQPSFRRNGMSINGGDING